MCCVLETVRTAIKVVAGIVLVLACICIGVGLWALIGGGGPLAIYLSSESWTGIKIVGGLLVAAGAVLAVDFVLACCNSTKLLSTCCTPLFLVFAIFTTLLFVGVGVISLTIMGDMLRTSLETAFQTESTFGVTPGQGALGSAQKDYNCCGSYKCGPMNITQYGKYNCGQIASVCLEKEGCVDAIMKDLLVIFKYPLAIGCFAVAAVTCLMFILSIMLCCL